MRRLTLALSVVVAFSAILAIATLAATPSRPEPVAQCLGERFVDWPGDYHTARLRPGVAATRIPADDPCLEGDPAKCTHRLPLAPDRRWFAGARKDGWVCVTDGKSFGWTDAATIDLGPLPVTKMSDWTGEWKRDDQAELKIVAKGRKVAVTGDAFWKSGGPDAVPHTGDIDDSGRVEWNSLPLGDQKCFDRAYGQAHAECVNCVVHLLLINGRLFVRDNYHCGGMNVTFSGIYDRSEVDRPRRGSSPAN